MHRKENNSIPRIDLLVQSRSYIRHTEKMKKMKPAVDTSCIEPVRHFSVAHKEKEKEWKYADTISKMCYSQIKSSYNRTPRNLSSSLNFSQRPQFNNRAYTIPSSPKGGIYNYPSAFDSTSLSAYGVISNNISPKTLIDDDGDVTSDTSSIFLTQSKKRDYKRYKYSDSADPKLIEKMKNDDFQVSVKGGMKFVKFSCEKKDEDFSSNDERASRLNSGFRKTFFIGRTKPTIKERTKENDSDLYSQNFDMHFDFKSNSNNKEIKAKKKNKKLDEKMRFIDNFEHVYKRSVKLKIKSNLSYEYNKQSDKLSIVWADKNDLLTKDEIENDLQDAINSSQNSSRTAVNFTFDSDSAKIPIVLELSSAEIYESFELEVSGLQHVLDIHLQDDDNSNSEIKNISEIKEIGENEENLPKNALESLTNQLTSLLNDNDHSEKLNHSYSDYSYYSGEEEKT